MKAASDAIEFPLAVLQSVDTLGELEDWLLARNPRLQRGLRKTCMADVEGKFKLWKPRVD